MQQTTVPLVVLSPPTARPNTIEFRFQAGPSQISKLKDGIARIKNGATSAQVIDILGPPSRQELTSRKEKPNDITGHLYYYDVRIVEPGTANVFDQQIILDFDYHTNQLRQITSSVPEIK